MHIAVSSIIQITNLFDLQILTLRALHLSFLREGSASAGDSCGWPRPTSEVFTFLSLIRISLMTGFLCTNQANKLGSLMVKRTRTMPSGDFGVLA